MVSWVFQAECSQTIKNRSVHHFPLVNNFEYCQLIATPLLLTYVFFSTTNTTMVSSFLLINLPKINQRKMRCFINVTTIKFIVVTIHIMSLYIMYLNVALCYTASFVMTLQYCTLGSYWAHWKRVVFLQAIIGFVMKMFYFKKSIGIFHGADYNTKER